MFEVLTRLVVVAFVLQQNPQLNLQNHLDHGDDHDHGDDLGHGAVHEHLDWDVGVLLQNLDNLKLLLIQSKCCPNPIAD